MVQVKKKMKVSEEDHKKLFSLYRAMMNTPMMMVGTGHRINTLEEAEKRFQAYYRELANKYNFDPEKFEIGSNREIQEIKEGE